MNDRNPYRWTLDELARQTNIQWHKLETILHDKKITVSLNYYCTIALFTVLSRSGLTVSKYGAICELIEVADKDTAAHDIARDLSKRGRRLVGDFRSELFCNILEKGPQLLEASVHIFQVLPPPNAVEVTQMAEDLLHALIHNITNHGPQWSLAPLLIQHFNTHIAPFVTTCGCPCRKTPLRDCWYIDFPAATDKRIASRDSASLAMEREHFVSIAQNQKITECDGLFMRLTRLEEIIATTKGLQWMSTALSIKCQSI